MIDSLSVYRYPAELCGGDAGVRLAGPGVVSTTDPRAADLFVVPQTLAFMAPGTDDLRRPPRIARAAAAFLALPHLAGNEARHVVLDCVEGTPPPPVPGVHYFRCGDCPERLLREYPSAVAWPWPVDDLGMSSDAPFLWDVGYVGYDTPLDLSRRAVASCARVFGKRFRHVWRDHAWGWQRNHNSADPAYRAETAAHRAEYVEQVRGSRLTLEPVAGRGIWRYRFFEAWAMGRIPVHIGDGCGRPFEDRIDYDALALFIPEADVDRTGELCDAWLAEHTDDALRALGFRARAAYDTWLRRDRWDTLMTEVVRQRRSAG